jgi:hypothetical protein
MANELYPPQDETAVILGDDEFVEAPGLDRAANAAGDPGNLSENIPMLQPKLKIEAILAN